MRGEVSGFAQFLMSSSVRMMLTVYCCYTVLLYVSCF